MSIDRRAILENLFDQTAEYLLDRVTSGEATAAEVNNVIKFLKDNDITADPAYHDRLSNIRDSLPVFDDEIEVPSLRL